MRAVMSALHKIIKAKKKSKWVYPSRLILLLLIGLGYWAHVTKLDEVAVASGRVIPQGKVKTVQHLEGGIINELNIREGAKVLEGDPLMVLTLGVGKLNRTELLTELDGYRLVMARVEAEGKGLKKPNFPPESEKRRPDVARPEPSAFKARHQELSGQLSVIRKQIRQKELAIESLRTRRSAASNNLDLAEENQALAEDAWAKGMGMRPEYQNKSREVENLLGDIRTIDADNPTARAHIEDARAHINEKKLRNQHKASAQYTRDTW